MTQRVRERPERPTARSTAKSDRTRTRTGSAPGSSEPHKIGLREPIRSIVEPLLVERRRKVADEGRRIRAQRIRILAVITVVAAIVAGALHSPLFDVDRITVSGSVHVTPRQVEQISGLQHGTPLVRVDVDRATAALRSNPWIAYAKVRRNYPGTVSIEVAEERPILLLRSDQGSALISRNGRVLEFEPESVGRGDPPSANDRSFMVAEYDGRIAEDSPTGSPLPGRHVSREVRTLVRLAGNMTPPVASRLDHVAFDRSGDLDLVLKDGAVVLLGPADELTAKLAAAGAVLDQVDLECLARIDVRNPTRATVMRRDGCQIRDRGT